MHSSFPAGVIVGVVVAVLVLIIIVTAAVILKKRSGGAEKSYDIPFAIFKGSRSSSSADVRTGTQGIENKSSNA